MLAPKYRIIVYTNTNMIMIQRKGKSPRLYNTTARGSMRLYRVLNEVVNKLYGPRVEFNLSGFTVEW